MDAIYAGLRGMAEAGSLPDLFRHAFMVRALLAGLLLAPLLGFLSPLVLTRRLAFFSAALGHAALTGVALGVLLGMAPAETQGVVVALALTVALAMTWVRRHGALSGDAVVGVFLSFTLGLGICLLSLATRRFDIHQIEGVMFGNLVTLRDADLAVLLGVGAVALLLLGPVYDRLLLASVHPDVARAHGARVARDEYLLATVLALVVVASLKMIGFLLVEGLMVVPAAAARQGARSLRAWILGSMAVAVLATEVGTVASYAYPVPTGAAISLVLALLFAGGMLLGRSRGAAAAALLLLGGGAAAHPLDTHLADLRGPLRARLEAALADAPGTLDALRTQGFRPFRLDDGNDGFLLLPDWRAPSLLVLARGGAARVPLDPVPADARVTVTLAPGAGGIEARIRQFLTFRETPPAEVFLLGPPDLRNPFTTPRAPRREFTRVHRDGVYRYRAGDPRARTLEFEVVRRLRPDEPGPYHPAGELVVPLAPGSAGTRRVRVEGALDAVAAIGAWGDIDGRAWEASWSAGDPRPDPGFVLRAPAEPILEATTFAALRRAVAGILGPGAPLPSRVQELALPEGFPVDGIASADEIFLWVPGGTGPSGPLALAAHLLAHPALDGGLLGPRPDALNEALATAVAREALGATGRPDARRELDAALARALRGEGAPEGASLPALPGSRAHHRAGRTTHPTLRPVPSDPALTAAVTLLGARHGARALTEIYRDLTRTGGAPPDVGRFREAVAARLGADAVEHLPTRGTEKASAARLETLARELADLRGP